MADSNMNDALRNLNRNLKEADTNLATLSKNFHTVFADAVRRAAQDAGADIGRMFDVMAGKVGAAKANKLKMLFELVDEHGEEITPQKLKAKIDRIANAAVNKEGTKVRLGFEWVDYEKAMAQLERFKQQYKLLKDMPGAYDTALRLSNQSVGGATASGTALGRARAKEMAEVQKYTKLANDELLRQQQIEQKIAEIRARGGKSAQFEGERRSIAQLNNMLEDSRRQVEAYKRTLQGLGTRGRDAAAGFGGDGSKSAIKEQTSLMRELYNLTKQYRQMQDQQRNGKVINPQDLEDTRRRLREILADMKRIEAEHPGSRKTAAARIETERLRDRWKEVHRETKAVNTSFISMIPNVQRLASAFGIAFSVQGLAQFGKKLVETRGEFEMQFVAMKQIIGDVDKATKIWNQTMQQALQSPFKAMQLTDYTKKLAAYRIETEKLFDTTKRLADVSAGLGVDMQRLILAYGQVKTANYLRASEVRQFTEAGVNIYGELAKYFSEIEGRAVGTAEMVERVSKRMVLFSDVEKIFQRMTDEGGAFFNMQEIQADTVRGQIMKLHDAYDQMLNTIGQGNDGPIRNLIDALNSLVRNWREVSFTLKANINWVTLLGGGVFMLASKWLPMATTQTLWFSKAILGNSKVLLKDTADIKIFSKVLGDYTLKQRMAIVATRSLQGALYGIGNALRAIWPLLVFEGIVQGIRLVTKSYRELKQIREELGEVASTNVESMNDEINGYEKLIKKLEKTNEGSIERKEILNEISSKYGKYLDFVVDETTKVEDLAGAYDKVVSSIRTYTAEKIREEQQQRIEKAMYDEYQEMVSGLTGKKLQTPGTSSDFKITKVQAKRIAKIIQETLKEGGVVDIQQILNDYFGGDVGTVGAGGGFMAVGNVIRDYISQYKELADELRDIRDDIEDETPVFKTKAEYDDYNNRRELADRELQEQKKRNEELITQIKQNNTEQWKAEELLKEQRIANIKAQMAILEKYGLKQSSLYSELSNSIKNNLDDYETDYNKRLEALLQSESKFGIFWKQNEKDLVSIYNAVVSTNDRLQQGTEQWNKQIRESYKGIQESLKQYEAALKAGGDEKTLNKNIDWAKFMMRAYEIAAKLRGINLTETKHTGGQQKESVSKMLSLLREMNSEYEKLSKSAYGYAKAEDRVRESFERSFKAIFKVKGGAGQYIDMANTKFDTKQDLADALQALYDGIKKKRGFAKFAKGTEEELLKAIDSARVEADIDVQVRIREDFARQMEDAFNDYDLTLELQNLGISEDMARDLFPDLDYTSIGKLQEIMKDFYDSRQTKDEKGNVLFSVKDLEEYKKWADKIDAEILKSRKEKVKQYSKYLEKEYSERAKLEMKHAQDIAFVTANIADEVQRKNIIENINRKYQNDLNDLNWRSFKESDFYVEMMDDISSLPREYMQMMLDKIEEILQNPETLSPRALKEAINARQKVLEAQMNLEPLDVMRSSLTTIKEAQQDKEVGGKNWKQTKENINKAVAEQAELIKGYDNEIQRLQTLQGGLAGYEKALENLQKADSNVDIPLLNRVLGFDENGRITSMEDLSDDAIQELIDRLTTENTQEKEKYDATVQTDEMNARAVEISDRERIIKLLTDELTARRELSNYQMSDAATAAVATGKTSTSVGSEIQEVQGKKDTSVKKIQNFKQYLKAFTQFDAAFAKFNAAINSTLNAVAGMGNAFYDMFDALGGETDALTDGWKEFGNTMISSITNALTMIPMMVAAFTAAGIAINSAMGIIGLIAEALNLLMTAITAISKLHDAGYEKEIENQQKKIDELKAAYERLEKAIEKTWITMSYIDTYNQQVENIKQQIEALEAQRNAENSKKNTDEDKIREYGDSIQEAYDELEELEQKRIEVFGGLGEVNYRSAAEEFGSAWKDAFLETGDGLEALQEHFDEFLQEWFVKQATMRIAGAMLERTFRMIDESVNESSEGGVAVTMAELQAIRDEFADQAPLISEALGELAGMWDLGNGEGSLSGLAAGIQGMTEEQANILEAYWNSVRMYTANIDGNVERIANILGAGGSATNPQLQQLQIIAQHTQAIHTLLDNVTRSGHPQGGLGIKVFNS